MRFLKVFSFVVAIPLSGAHGTFLPTAQQELAEEILCLRSLHVARSLLPEARYTRDESAELRVALLKIQTRLRSVNFFSQSREDLLLIETMLQLDDFFSIYWKIYRGTYERTPHRRKQILERYFRFRLHANESFDRLAEIAPGVIDALTLPGRSLTHSSHFALFEFLSWLERQKKNTAHQGPSIYFDASVLGYSTDPLERGERIRLSKESLSRALGLPEVFTISMLPTGVLEQGETFERIQKVIDPIRIANRFQKNLSSEDRETLEDLTGFMVELKVGSSSRPGIPQDAWMMAEAFFDNGGIFVTNDYKIADAFLKLRELGPGSTLQSRDERFLLRLDLEKPLVLGAPFHSQVPLLNLRILDRQTDAELELGFVFVRQATK